MKDSALASIELAQSLSGMTDIGFTNVRRDNCFAGSVEKFHAGAFFEMANL
ncbi:hypothetical protein [Rhizobium sp. P32RR-XVIII]|uniref:hypothetical protein n=1 Tax=Rhizobium sp. P32RR-XVIII TaxID=2726738 RepID=UPI001FEE07B3|nr:hypothetical protein [Rhizobium sp. P32RR-XVIII]